MKDPTFSIMKAACIIFMVMGHAACPSWMSSFFAQFHMPVFFICSGYFFKKSYLDDGATFLRKRFTGLYKPFIVWAIIFLSLHNLFTYWGITNGSGSEYFTWKVYWQRVWSCFFNMSGYDDLLCGAFWFFRALLLVNLGYWALSYFIRKTGWLKKDWQYPVVIGAFALLMALWKTSMGLRVTGVWQGGFRDLMGIYFFSVGILLHRYEAKVPIQWWSALLSFGLLLAFEIFGWRGSMSIGGSWQVALALSVSSVAGYILLRYMARLLLKLPAAFSWPFVYVGERTLYVFAFHAISFKLVSLIKVGYYGIPYDFVGGTMTVHYRMDDYFYWLYTLVGVAVPLCVREVYLRLKKKRVSAH